LLCSRIKLDFYGVVYSFCPGKRRHSESFKCYLCINPNAICYIRFGLKLRFNFMSVNLPLLDAPMAFGIISLLVYTVGLLIH
jgi:hypothetical protein